MVYETADAPPAEPISFEIEEARTPTSHSLALRGELDISAAPIVRDRLAAALAAGVPVVVCDLAQVTFMDSSGLSVLISAHKRAATAGVRLVLSSVQPRVARLLDVSGVKEYLLGKR